MRVAGWVLLVAGFLLCLSVAWAALGFLLMGVGLVSLEAAARQQRKAAKAAAADITVYPELAAALIEAAAPAHAEDAEVAPQPPPLPAPDASPSTEAYDKDIWRRLIESDAELAQIVAVLADYGQHFVDEFATSYLAAPDKSRIAGIVDEIIAKASQAKAAPNARPADPAAPSPAERDTDTPAVPLIRITADQIRLEPDRTGATITSADDDLSDMIRRFAPDSNFLGKR